MPDRLSILVDVWDPARGGLESYAAALARELTARDLPVEVLCGRALAPLPSRARCLDVDGLAFYRAVDAQHARGQLGVPLSFRHPGAVGGVFLPLGGAFADALAARRAAEPRWRRPFARLSRVMSPRTRELLARERAFFAADDPESLVLCASRRTAAAIVARSPGFVSRIEVTGLPVDDEAFRPPSDAERRAVRRELALTDDRIALLWIGHDARRKGRGRAIAAARLLREQGVENTLLLAGRGAGREAPGVRSLGPRGDVARLLHAVDLLVHPTFEDNLAIAVLEALASGVPVVTTSADGAAEFVARAPDAQVVDPRANDDELAAACRRALAPGSASDRRAALRAAVAPCFAARHFDRMAATLAPLLG